MITTSEEKIIAVFRENNTASNAEIALALNLSIRTIENQLNNLYKKLKINGVNNQRRMALILLIHDGKL